MGSRSAASGWEWYRRSSKGRGGAIYELTREVFIDPACATKGGPEPTTEPDEDTHNAPNPARERRREASPFATRRICRSALAGLAAVSIISGIK